VAVVRQSSALAFRSRTAFAHVFTFEQISGAHGDRRNEVAGTVGVATTVLDAATRWPCAVPERKSYQSNVNPGAFCVARNCVRPVSELLIEQRSDARR
jgi:hypothetical protein